MDESWLSRYDPYGLGQEENEEPTSPVIVQGRVHYTTNTQMNVSEPMRIFWQAVDATYDEQSTPLTGQRMLADVDGPGWSFFHLAVDDISGTIVGIDQGAGAVVALRIQSDGTMDRLWQKSLTISVRPVIMSDRQQVYVTDWVDGVNHLVMLELQTGKKNCGCPRRRHALPYQPSS